MAAASAISVRGQHALSSRDSWDTMLPGPPSRDNGGGCADFSAAGLLAYGAGSSVVVADPRSMQLVSVLPMPPPSRQGSCSSYLAPFVTSVRWIPQSLPRDLLAVDEPSASHLRLAVGDLQGRIAIWDFRCRRVLLWLEFDSSSSSDKTRLGVQDLCWVHSDSWILASINGPSLIALWDTSSGRCIWKYDASPEFLSCLRRDPFDARHLCALGLRGFILSAKVLCGGTIEDVDVILKEHQVPGTLGDLAEFQRIEKETLSSVTASASAPAFSAFPPPLARFCFSPRWRYIILVTFPREMIMFDLQYGTSLSCISLPRGCGKIMDVVADPDEDLVYCVHLDGKLSTWKRKDDEQVHVLCMMEDLIPSVGTPIPSPAVLAMILCQVESTIQHVGNLSYDLSSTSCSSCVNHQSPVETTFTSKKYLLSISDDGKIWKWLLVMELAGAETASQLVFPGDNDGQSKSDDTFVCVQDTDEGGEMILDNSNTKQISSPSSTEVGLFFKISLTGQLHLLSSTVTTLAVPCPSLMATLACGGNNPAAAVPLVALGTQIGNIDVIDVSANAVATSFCVHNSPIKGLRWLGNSRLVSFSHGHVNEKGGGFTNRLVVTCLRSGLNRTFRVMQKPERAPIRALRASSSGRYLLILFRDAPVEVWAMTKNPIMLRSLALPFTVMEWTLPTAPRPNQNGTSPQSSFSLVEKLSISDATSNESSIRTKGASSDASADDVSESFAFALVNGALGVFEVHGRRIRDFRPKWPSSSFVSSDGLVTAMAYRLPHVVMGDRSGNIRWWDVTTGLSSSFNTYREGIRRIKFSPVVAGDRSRGRIAVLFYDNTFSVFDLDTQDPLANSLLQPQSPGTLVLDLDWLPTRTRKNEPLVLCITGADSSFRLIEVNINDPKQSQPKVLKERFRPVPLSLPMLLPTAHVLALRMILQIGVKPSWFSPCSTYADSMSSDIPDNCRENAGDLRNYMIKSMLPIVGDPVVPELLLKVLEPYRIEGCLLDAERVRLYASLVNKGAAARFAFAAAIFGEFSEALFWLQLPHALHHLIDKSSQKSTSEASLATTGSGSAKLCTRDSRTSIHTAMSSRKKNGKMKCGQLNLMAFEKEELWTNAKERITWHENLEGEDAIQNRVHELVSIGNLEAAVTLLLSTPPEGTYFYPNALRAVVLSSAVSESLHELAVKVVAANMVRTDKSLSGIHLLCAVGRYQEACSQLQDAGFWTDAATLAATYLHGSDYARVLQRWADHVLHIEHNIWRSLILYVAAGAANEALAALRDAQHVDTAALFLLACHEISAQIALNSENLDVPSKDSDSKKQQFVLPFLEKEHDVIAVSEYYGQYQRKLVHLCMDSVPSVD